VKFGVEDAEEAGTVFKGEGFGEAVVVDAEDVPFAVELAVAARVISLRWRA